MDELETLWDSAKWTMRASGVALGAYQLNGALELIIDQTYRASDNVAPTIDAIQRAFAYGAGGVTAVIGIAMTAGSIASGIKQLRRNRRELYLVDGMDAASASYLLSRKPQS